MRKPPVLILGSGIAGLSAALRCAEFSDVILVSKSEAEEGATRYAQGGIASVWSSSDSFASHESDTKEAGAGLCRPSVVSLCVREGPARVKDLVDLGVQFTKKEGESDFDLHREGGHLHHRILHANDLTGLAIERALLEKARAHPRVKLLERYAAIDLVTDSKLMKRFGPASRCLGAYVLEEATGKIHGIAACATILATGGAGKAYLYTTNPDVSTGDGIAMAVRAGARVANLEFMQFHPTCLYHPEARRFLISEALRGEGAVLRNLAGVEFMKAAHELGSLAPRDIVARAIDAEMKRTGAAHVWLDARALGEEALSKKFPHIFETCRRFGIDPARGMIPVVPAAHYTCGGVVADEWGRATVEGLYALGETACTGLHGANRLASNSLLEAVVFAERAASSIRKECEAGFEEAGPFPRALPEWDSGHAVKLEEKIDIAASWLEIRTLMWNYVGIVRSDRRLLRAKRRLQVLHEEIGRDYWNFVLTKDLIELRNLVLVAQMIVESALQRRESRGLHYTVDYPFTDDAHFLRDTVL